MGPLTPHQVLIQRFVELHPEEVARQLNDAGTDEAVGVLQREDAASAAKVLQQMELQSRRTHFGALGRRCPRSPPRATRPGLYRAASCSSRRVGARANPRTGGHRARPRNPRNSLLSPGHSRCPDGRSGQHLCGGLHGSHRARAGPPARPIAAPRISCCATKMIATRAWCGYRT